MTVCKDGGTFSTVLVIDDEKEQEAGWGRGYSVTGEEIDEATPLQPDEVVVSETIASSLQLLDRDRVYIKLNLPSAFATIVQGESDDIALWGMTSPDMQILIASERNLFSLRPSQSRWSCCLFCFLYIRISSRTMSKTSFSLMFPQILDLFSIFLQGFALPPENRSLSHTLCRVLATFSIPTVSKWNWEGG